MTSSRSRFARGLTLAGLLLGLVSGAGAQTVWYVDDDAPLGGTGQDWSSPFRYLQDALAAAVTGDEIRVGGGVYRPDQAEGGQVTPGDRTATFQLIDGVALRGGFAGFGAADPDERDFELYETMLSGDLAGNDLPGFTNYGENSLHVVTGGDVGGGAVIEGVSITAGYGNDASDPQHPNAGGGLKCVAGSPTVTACTFKLNLAAAFGGAVLLAGGQPTFTDCFFDTNRATYGGGVDARGGASATFVRCQFAGHWAVDGAAVRTSDAGSPSFTSCKFSGNVAAGSGGAIFARGTGTVLLSGGTFRSNTANWGGAVAVRVGSPLMIGCEFSENAALRSGGAVFATQHASPVFENSAFTRNRAPSGGGVYIVDDGSPLFTNCAFDQNVGTASGGAIYFAGTGWPTVSDCVFTANSANWGGGVANQYGGPFFTGCTFADNSGSFGGGLYAGTLGSVAVYQSVFRGNAAYTGGGLCNDGGSNPTLGDVLFEGNVATHAGGAVYCAEFCNPGIVQCEFRGNAAAAQGGGLACRGGSVPAIVACRFINNLSYGAGGALHLADAVSAELGNTKFVANVAGATGGAAHVAEGSNLSVTNCLFNGNRAEATGGGACWNEVWSSLRLANCTVVGNSGAATGGVASGATCVLRAANSIFWGNADDAGGGEVAQVSTGGEPAEIDYCCVAGWSGALGGVGNFGTDPFFVDPSGSDGLSGTEDDDLQLADDSPCIDAGDNTAVPADIFDLDRDGDSTERVPFDLHDATRLIEIPEAPNNGAGVPPLVDLGAFEHRRAPVLGDLNCDGLLTFDDINPFLLVLTDDVSYAAQYPECDPNLADCNSDGVVNDEDVDAFIARLIAGV